MMCEKRIKKIKRGSEITRSREARRLQRLQRLRSPQIDYPIPAVQCPPSVDKTVQNRVLLELAWKTVALMYKNKLIQQKIVALQKETKEFVTSVLNNPENRRRYLEHINSCGIRTQLLEELKKNRAEMDTSTACK